MTRNILWLLTCCILLLTACDKRMVTADTQPETTTPTTNGKPPISDKKVQAGVQGRITDEKNNPLAGARVLCGDQNTITDEYGVFRFTTLNITEAAAVVTVQKPGYFNGIRTFQVTGAGKEQFVQIQLLPKTVAGTFDAATGGMVAGPNAQFIFVPNQVLDASNQPYKGKATLTYAFINPERNDFADIMPGDLRAVNDKNELVGLQSFGMMALELQAENGEKLHLDGRNSVTFRMEIPATLRKTAPAVIPLWHFEESTGLWRQEGSAEKMGDSYVGTVKHFSFWNCDAQFPIVNLNATFKDDQGNPLPNTIIQMTRSNGSESYGYTDANGEVRGMVPANEQVTISIKDKCGKIMFSRKAGPWTTDANAGVFNVTIDPQARIAISGTVTTCDGAAVTKGLVNVQVDGITYKAPIQNGAYSSSVLRCATGTATVTLNPVDETANKMSTVTYQLAPGTYTRDLQACDVIQASTVSFLLEGQTSSFTSPADSIQFISHRSDTSNYVSYTIYATPKSGQGNQITMRLSDIKVGTTTNYISVSMNGAYYSGQAVSVTITHTGVAGEYLDATFSGNVQKSQNGTTVPISGSFKVRIE
ncbi:carboxypeptidase-like regulatory domain-containing protein [Chitinophaga qingshengii]|uniref:Carboxypeptidase regulatory-like domain-containing protein n=1 Tax=Chitinophaga qingshengii TaxID=1569794 RepID=A0ABR7TMM2_9BACT|nr:carboxypeptidase-like regulatory domain-containing protein [Chitinophaga qingshengii]MBC9931732.1 carboxypeptidase regulatory-like domain-containing protein [Chitinophaga qingshengii]